MKYLRVFLLFLFSFFIMPVLNAVAAETAGFVERIKGEVTVTSEDGVRSIGKGDVIYVDDSILTGQGSRLIVQFNDGSKVTLGENAQIIVDELVYESANPDKSKQNQTIDFVRGVYSYVSGQIAHLSYENVVLRTPVATIGIRGTKFIGGELTVGMPAGRSHIGFQIQEGSIEVLAPGGSVILDKPGEGTFLPLTKVAAPTPVKIWTPAIEQEAIDALAF